MKHKNGFTLAELAMTMGILGVIAAITLPILNNARPNQEMIMLKKAYYNTTRIVSELINDDDLYPERSEDIAHSGFANISIKDMIDGVTEAKYQGKPYSGNGKFCGLFAAKMGVTNANCEARKSLDEGGNFTTPDGIIWSMPYGDFSSGTETIYVDVIRGSSGKNCFTDGAPAVETGKTPNVCATNIPPDRFAITVGKFGEVAPSGNIAQEYITSNSTTKKYIDFIK